MLYTRRGYVHVKSNNTKITLGPPKFLISKFTRNIYLNLTLRSSVKANP